MKSSAPQPARSSWDVGITFENRRTSGRRIRESVTASAPNLYKDSLHYVSFLNASKFHVEALETVDQLAVVDTQKVQHRGVQIANMDGILYRVIAQIVG